MQRLEVSGAVRPIYGSLGVKRLIAITGFFFSCLAYDPCAVNSLCSVFRPFGSTHFIAIVKLLIGSGSLYEDMSLAAQSAIPQCTSAL